MLPSAGSGLNNNSFSSLHYLIPPASLLDELESTSSSDSVPPPKVEDILESKSHQSSFLQVFHIGNS
jgi:hypothetical protein